MSEVFDHRPTIAGRIPLMPPPEPHEAFGSWLRRCASVHRLNSREEFAAGVLALDREQLPVGPWDWDIAPPLVLLQALARRTEYGEDQLARMLVPLSPSVLRQSERDAFCQSCSGNDTWGGAVQRKDWLDAWTLTCAVHGDVLACQAAPPHWAPGSSEASGAKPLVKELEQLPRPHPFTPVPLALRSRASGAEAVHVELGAGGWFDPNLLRSEFGRRLMLLMGCKLGSNLFYTAIGLEPKPWLDDDGRPCVSLNVAAPRARLRTRLLAAMAASVLYDDASARTRAAVHPDVVVSLLEHDLSSASKYGLAAVARAFRRTA